MIGQTPQSVGRTLSILLSCNSQLQELLLNSISTVVRPLSDWRLSPYPFVFVFFTAGRGGIGKSLRVRSS